MRGIIKINPPKAIANVKNLGLVLEAEHIFASESLITPRDEALARMVTAGKEKIGNFYGTWTSMGVEYTSGQPPLLVRHSRLFDSYLRKAVKANFKKEYLSIGTSPRKYNESLKIAVQDQKKPLSEREVIKLPMTSFIMNPLCNVEVLEFLLEEQSLDYFRLSGCSDIKFDIIDPDEVGSYKGTIFTQLWFGSICHESYFSGSKLNLEFNANARSVKKVSNPPDMLEGILHTINPYVAPAVIPEVKGKLEDYLNSLRE